MTTKNTIAFLGLGAMGSRMASHLLAAGHDLIVWNRDPAKAEPLRSAGAKIASSPLAAAAEAAHVFSMVRDDEAAKQVWLEPDHGALAALRPDAVAVECSTLSLAGVGELAARFSAAGRQLLEAPVVGSRPQADQRQLIFLAAGQEATLSGTKELLLQMGAQVHHVGPLGAGAAAKLFINALFGVQVCALGELIAAVRRRGYDPARLVEAMASTPVASPAAKAASQAMLAAAFAPAFPVNLVLKDFGYVVAAAGGADLAPLSAAARGVFEEAQRRGMGGDNLTGVVRLFP